MRILLVSDYAVPQGGAEIATRQLRDGLLTRGHTVRWFASTGHQEQASSAADVECFGTTGPLRTLFQSANPAAYAGLSRTIADFQPDVVHVGMFLTQLSPLILPALRNRASVYYAHWLRAICPTGSKLLPDGTACSHRAGRACYTSGCLPARDWAPVMTQLLLLRRWRHFFTRTVANSLATKAALQADGFPVTDVIPCGAESPAEQAEFGDVPTAIFSGRLTRQKGVHVLLDAWAEVTRTLPGARLLIVGDGPERATLERHAPPNVVFLGQRAHHDLPRVARQAWVQVVPSIGFESFGLVAVEAMLRGQAIIASRVGGLPELVQAGDTGLLVEPGDGAALANALCTLLRDRALCERLGSEGKRAANARFAIDLHVDRFISLYRDLLRPSRTP